jgi:hypothetical protein
MDWRGVCSYFVAVVAVVALAQGARAQGSAAEGTASTQAAASSPTSGGPAAGLRATHTVAVLKTAVTSHGNLQGKEISAQTSEATVLPDGTRLPKGTMLHGVVAQVSAHSKAKPNGALMLLFDEARPKDAPPIPLLVKIREIAPSAQSEMDRNNLPGARLGGSSNSGGTQQKQFTDMDHSEIRYNEKATGIKGVLLQTSSGGSGVVFSVDTDVYLDEGIGMTLVLARAPKTP